MSNFRLKYKIIFGMKFISSDLLERKFLGEDHRDTEGQTGHVGNILKNVQWVCAQSNPVLALLGRENKTSLITL